jgi:hypothetical protein
MSLDGNQDNCGISDCAIGSSQFDQEMASLVPRIDDTCLNCHKI